MRRARKTSLSAGCARKATTSPACDHPRQDARQPGQEDKARATTNAPHSENNKINEEGQRGSDEMKENNEVYRYRENHREGLATQK